MRLVGLLVLLLPQRDVALEPHRSAPSDSTPPPVVRIAYFAPRVQRFLALQFYHYTDEFAACLIGEQRGDTLVVARVDPADLDPTDLTPTTVNWRRPCSDSAPGSVGTIHSHPQGAACYFKLPTERPRKGRIRIQLGGDSIWTQDAVYLFERIALSITAIMCGDSIVWMGRDSVARVATLPDSLRATWLSRHKH